MLRPLYESSKAVAQKMTIAVSEQISHICCTLKGLLSLKEVPECRINMILLDLPECKINMILDLLLY